MAARSDAPVSEVIDLSDLAPRDLDPLLEEEIGVWEQRFDWDFRPAADLLRRFLHIRSLTGCALRVGDEIAGYAYSVSESRKGLIGDLYVRAAYANRKREMELLDAVVHSLMRSPGLRRIESQLMLIRPASGASFPSSQYVKRHDRLFMQISSAAISKVEERAPSFQVSFVPWVDRHSEEAAQVLAACYRGHVDGEINDQYRSIPGARMFLGNITRYPGCGRFAPSCSMLAIDNASGRVCGMSLTSHVAAHSGHITQLCILPGVRHSGLGYELLRQSLRRLVESGCNTVSLTVTATNADAIRLYESIGFVNKASFPALVWESF
jgi:ribosomal protein S18 acetylase RimI-like enzyme